MRLGRSPPALIGFNTFPGSSSASVLRHEKTQASRRRNLCMVALFPCQANFYLPPSRRQVPSSANCSHPSPAWLTALAVLRRRHLRQRHSTPPHWSTCGRRHCRRVCRLPIAVLTASGCPALSTSWWTSAAPPGRSLSTASSLTSGSPRPLQLRPLAVAGLLCCRGHDSPSPLPKYEAGGGGVMWRPSTRLRALEKSASV
jgi:hypothetical protein